MPDERLDAATAARMGYDDIRAAKSIRSPDGHSLYEIALIGPDSGIYGAGYHIAVHIDCDPDRPNEGGSDFDQGAATSLAGGLKAFDARVSEVESEIAANCAPKP